jgi:hypothetical protein
MKATPEPIIVNLGKQKKKRIRQLKRGDAVAKIDQAIHLAQSRVGEGKEIVPVVILYRKKDRRRRRGVSLFGPF